MWEGEVQSGHGTYGSLQVRVGRPTTTARCTSMSRSQPTGATTVQIVAWADEYDSRLHPRRDAFSEILVEVNGHRAGDTWYRDMRVPGFAGQVAPDSDNSVQWLAKRIVADSRFAEATVKFWWPAIMGSEVVEPPEDEGDADFEGLLLAANAQGAEVTRLANGFRRGFKGGAAYNLKDLLVEIVLSKWFRADTVEDADPIRNVALRDAGARRLLTPEELDRKTAAITGYKWGRAPRINRGAHRGPRSRLTNEYRLLYGGIDSDGVTDRARDVTSVMAGVAKRHAARMSCPLVMRDFFLVPEAERRLFAGIDRFVTPGLEFGASFEIEAGLRDRAGDAVTERSVDCRSEDRAIGLHQRLPRRRQRRPKRPSRSAGRARCHGPGRRKSRAWKSCHRGSAEARTATTSPCGAMQRWMSQSRSPR